MAEDGSVAERGGDPEKQAFFDRLLNPQKVAEDLRDARTAYSTPEVGGTDPLPSWFSEGFKKYGSDTRLMERIIAMYSEPRNIIVLPGGYSTATVLEYAISAIQQEPAYFERLVKRLTEIQAGKEAIGAAQARLEKAGS